MSGSVRSTRASLLLWLLTICVPLCCCRVGMVSAMVNPDDARGSSCCAPVMPSCCEAKHGQDPQHQSPDEDHRHSAPTGDCKSSCCLKGMTIDTPADVALAHIFLDLVTVPIAPTVVPLTVAAPHPVYTIDLPPPARPTLLRLHCALII